jgi:hypothetical protein
MVPAPRQFVVHCLLGDPAAMIGTIIAMPLTIFDIKGVPGSRRELIEAAVVAGGQLAPGPHEAWIAVDPFKGGFRVLITGPQGFERKALRFSWWCYSTDWPLTTSPASSNLLILCIERLGPLYALLKAGVDKEPTP